jgi:transglutaminase-like putative cysteine protease
VMPRRAMVGGAIIVAWLAGLALLVKREYFRPQTERLAEAASRVAPGVVYYGVMQGNQQIGFASSTIDTTTTTIAIHDYYVADIPVGGKARHSAARMNVTLTRGMRMTDFDLELLSESAPIVATGHISGDSLLILSIASGKAKPDTQRVPISGPMLLPTTVPLALALSETPKVGKHYQMPVFDPASMAANVVSFDVQAESSFVVNDSAAFDSTTKRWHGTRPSPLRAWQINAKSTAGFNGWIDEQGRIVETTQLGFVLRRLPYEVAFDNWRAARRETAAVTKDRDILETTAIAANERLSDRTLSMRVRLTGVDLHGFDIQGQRQRLSGDTLTILPPPMAGGRVAGYRLPMSDRDTSNSRPEALIQSDDPRIAALAHRIIRNQKSPRAAAFQITRWVYDSLKKQITFGIPNAVEVLQKRSGDCNEHTQLFVALARAIGLPARVVAGLAFVDGKFFYHAWPEVLLDDWVAVDPTFGQYPADAAHLRFVIGGVARQTELLRLMGKLKIDVLSVDYDSHQAATRR